MKNLGFYGISLQYPPKYISDFSKLAINSSFVILLSLPFQLD